MFYNVLFLRCSHDQFKWRCSISNDLVLVINRRFILCDSINYSVITMIIMPWACLVNTFSNESQIWWKIRFALMSSPGEIIATAIFSGTLDSRYMAGQYITMLHIACFGEKWPRDIGSALYNCKKSKIFCLVKWAPWQKNSTKTQ